MKTYNTNHGSGERKDKHEPPRLRLIADNPPHRRDESGASASRQESVRTFLIDHLHDPITAPIAAALAALRPDGSVDILIADVEPEFADALADGLETIAQRLRAHARKRFRGRADSGFASLAVLLPVVFAIATYFNEVAWLDAAITLASHFSAFLILPAKIRRAIRTR